jgi:hypothetical protein
MAGQMSDAFETARSKSRRIRLKDTNLPWKFFAGAEDASVRVYVLSRMPNVQPGRAK